MEEFYLILYCQNLIRQKRHLPLFDLGSQNQQALFLMKTCWLPTIVAMTRGSSVGLLLCFNKVMLTNTSGNL